LHYGKRAGADGGRDETGGDASGSLPGIVANPAGREAA